MALSSLLADLDFSALLDASDGHLHPLDTAQPDIASLTQLLERTAQLRSSLQQSFTAFAFEPEPRVVALLKEHTGHERVVENSQREAREYAKALKGLRANNRAGGLALYGEDVPLAHEQVAEYVLSRIEKTTSAAGLEVFKDEQGNAVEFTCGGKLLVLDMKFTMASAQSTSTKPPEAPITLESLHITHAPAPGDETASVSAAAQAADDHLPELLSNMIRQIIRTCTTHDPVPDGRAVSALLKKYKSHLEHLVFLDELTAKGPPYGVRWLRETGALTEFAEVLTAAEAQALSTATGANPAPLDVLLYRGHAVPLPNLIGPSLSFLPNISPKTYLSLQRTHSSVSESSMDVDTPGGSFDVSSTKLRHFLSSSLARPPRRKGPGEHCEDLFTIATLSLKRNPPPPAASTEGPASSVTATQIDARPFFPLLEPPATSDNQMQEDHSVLSASVQPIRAHDFMRDNGVEWVLDLQTCSLTKADSKSPEDARGVWLTQSSAAAIGSIIGVSVLSGVSPDILGIGVGGVPVITDEVHDPLGLGVNIEFSSPSGTPRFSWFDRLVNPEHPVAVPKYRATISSESRPAIRMTFAPRAEPGFYVSRVPVRSLKQVYAVLEVLRDQLPISQFLRTVAWEPQYEHRSRNESYVSIHAGIGNGGGDEEVDLDSLLNGTYTPASIPCTLEVQHLLPYASGSGWDPSSSSARPTLHLSFPLPRPGSPLTSVTISHDVSAPLGVRVLISAPEATLEDELVGKLQRGAEEFVRRGGGLRVVRWIWDHCRSA